MKDIITDRVVSVAPETKVSEVARKMAEENVGAVLVCEDKKPRGILTDRDIVIRCISKEIDVDDCTVEQILTEPVECVQDTDGIFDCIRKMSDMGVRRIPVVNSNGEVVGLVSFGDLIMVLGRELSTLAEAVTSGGGMEKENLLKVA